MNISFFRTCAPIALIVSLAAGSSGCMHLFYAGMKKLGKDKRDILVSRINDAKSAQKEAAKQFQSALDAFKAVTNFDGGELEKSYNHLNSELGKAQSHAKKVSERIDAIEHVSRDLFKEWGGEIDKMSEGTLKQDSRGLLRDSEQREAKLVAQMRSSEDKMKPVLQKLNDQVLFLKHNLNARAIASLKGESANIDQDVSGLVKDIEASIKEADSTIAGLNANSEQ